MILFSHYTGIKPISERHKFRHLKSLFFNIPGNVSLPLSPLPTSFLSRAAIDVADDAQDGGVPTKVHEGAVQGVDPPLGQ